MPNNISTNSATARKLSYSKSHIMVPEHIVQEIMDDPRLSTDLAFSMAAFTNARMSVRNPPHGSPESINIICADHLFPESTEAERWFRERYLLLHLVADRGDVLLAYEYLRLGLDPDVKNLFGRTPIWFALQTAVRLHTTPDSTITSEGRSNRLARQTRVSRLLIEQHIDVNQTHDDMTPLILACKARDWEIISLLLEHGAKKNFASKKMFSNEKHRKKFMDLVATKSLPEGKQRPARVCPCWSGKTLLECHGKPGLYPYPPSFLCICNSKKAHMNCCARKAPVYEYWDGVQIVPYTKYAADEPDGYQKASRAMQSLFFGKFKCLPDGTLRDLDNFPNVPFAALDPITLETFRQEMILLEKVDPAFAYGMSKYRFPFPSNRNSTIRAWRSGYQTNWNNAIEEYIKSGVDSRSRFDIERAAKIGQWRGPLIRDCAAPECLKVERRDVEKMLQCSRCQITVYCSKECQIADWKHHKAEECEREWQCPPFLPSQQNILNYMLEEIRKEPEHGEYFK